MRRVDLNLLYVLRELLREPSTTKVADRLGLTQSAVSASLGRLRWAFQDDLFVRSGRSLAPTRRAETLLEPVEQIISLIESLVEEVHFEPAKLQRTFTLAAADFLQNLIAGPIIAQMHPIAPLTKLVCTPYVSDTRDRLRSGHLDLMIAPVLLSNAEMDVVSCQEIYRDRLVAAVGMDNERYGDSISEEEYLNATHVDYNSNISGGYVSSTHRFLEENAIRIRSVAEFSTQIAMMHCLRHADVIATIPNKLVEAVAGEAQIRAVELPFEVPEIEVHMMWNHSFDNDPEHQWFRGLVEKACDARL